MSRRNELIIFVALIAVLGIAIYWNFAPTQEAGADSPIAVSIQPLRVVNPSLHLDKLDALRKVTYTGTHRNIFSATPPPPPAPVVSKQGKDAASVSTTPPPPPPLQVPLTFYGTSVDSASGKKLAFFTNGDDVYIASQGQTLLGRFRLVSIGTDTVELAEVSSGRQATLHMTPPETP